MEDEKIKTTDMTRKIREKFAKRLAGKTHLERIVFYRQRAMKMNKKIPILVKEVKPAGESHSNVYPAWPDNQNLVINGNSVRENRSSYKKGK